MRLIKTLILVLTISILQVGCNNDEVQPILSIEGDVGFIEDSFDGKSIVVYGNPDYQTLVAYEKVTESGRQVNFATLQVNYPHIGVDTKDNYYSILGVVDKGPDMGERLIALDQITGYWFAISSFYPKPEIFLESSGERVENQSKDEEWLIEKSMIFAGSIRDGIQSIDQPDFSDSFFKDDLNEDFYVKGDDLVTVLEEGDAIKVFPHSIMNWHEIVNDPNGNVISFCPLTSTSGAWKNITTQHGTFGVSGLLYNSNLILYDRGSETLWSQILGLAVNGPNIGSEVNRINTLEMTWSGAQQIGKRILLLTDNTGHNRNYLENLYDSYVDSDEVFYPLTHKDDRIPSKERVLAVIGEQGVRVYRFTHVE